MQYRQGDVLLNEVESIPEGIDAKDNNGRIILAEGEATGHAHVMQSRDVIARMVGISLYLQVIRETLLKHEEHGEIRVKPGNYQVIRQREYSPEEIRNVAD